MLRQMPLAVCLLSYLSLSQGQSRERIIGGHSAKAGQFKYAASLQIYNRLHYCGGAIISSRAILTAAHCAKPYIQHIRAMIGSLDYTDLNATRYHIERFIVHDKYAHLPCDFDIAIAVIAGEIKFNVFVQPIPLTTSRPQPGDRMLLSGWGYTDYPPPPYGPSIHLQFMHANVASDEDCFENYPDSRSGLCTYEAPKRGICSGDSGGPLINPEGQLAGIISAGYQCALGYPDCSSDVFALRRWIVLNAL